MPLSRTPHPEATHSGIRRYRATVRMRLALTYSALLTGSGIIMLGLVYVFMRFVPTYDLAAATVSPAATAVPAAPGLDPSPAPGSRMHTPRGSRSGTARNSLVTSTDQMLNLLLLDLTDGTDGPGSDRHGRRLGGRGRMLSPFSTSTAPLAERRTATWASGSGLTGRATRSRACNELRRDAGAAGTLLRRVQALRTRTRPTS